MQITVSAKTAAWYLRHGDVMPSSTELPGAEEEAPQASTRNGRSNQIRQEKRR